MKILLIVRIIEHVKLKLLMIRKMLIGLIILCSS
nr:MAG TPA: hypothetical protein [Crassvirales sp.]